MLNHIDVKIKSQFIVERLNRCLAELLIYNDSIERRGKQPTRIAGLVFYPNSPRSTANTITDAGIWFAITVWHEDNHPEKIYVWNTTSPISDVTLINASNKIECRQSENIIVENTQIPGTNFDNISIFDQVYISIEQFCFAAGICYGNATDCNEQFYFPTNKLINFEERGPHEFYVCPLGHRYYSGFPVPDSNQMYFQITNAFVVLDYSSETINNNGIRSRTHHDLTPFRTLKFNPYPEPNLSTDNDRPAIAYELGTPCPPMWKPYYITRQNFNWLDLLTMPQQYNPQFPGENPQFRSNRLLIPFVITIAVAILELVLITFRGLK